MAILPILVYPDPRLKQISAAVESFDDELRQFIADLNETLYDSPGCVGIAAPQVGAHKRLIIIDASRNAKAGPNHGRLVLINPEIMSSEGEIIAREGCLSLPHLTANVKRAKQITLNALNEEGELLSFATQDFEARLILHEYDHLDGLLFLDRVASLKTDVFRRKNYVPKPEEVKLLEELNLADDAKMAEKAKPSGKDKVAEGTKSAADEAKALN